MSFSPADDPLISTAFCYAPPADAAAHPTALVLLNCEGAALRAPAPPPLWLALWSVATLRLCADGAASRLFHGLVRQSCGEARGAPLGAGEATPEGAERALPAAAAALAAHLPHAILGDWDSLDARAEAYYRAAGVPLHPQPEDQDSTDLEKCLRHVVAAQEARAAAAGSGGGSGGGAGGRLRVVVAGSFGGRLDHTLQNLNCLYKWSRCFHALAMVTEHSVACLLPAGACAVRVAAPLEGPTCGLLPLAGPALVTTQGLQWDMQALPCSFGGMVSTSNAVRACSSSSSSSSSSGSSSGAVEDGASVGSDGAPLVRVHSTAELVWTINVNAERVLAAAAAAAPAQSS
jgi:thiamine pyrophosphokinase